MSYPIVQTSTSRNGKIVMGSALRRGAWLIGRAARRSGRQDLLVRRCER